ncbi:MAG TPA: hypothetical protein VGF06_00950 [Terriglobales bacterium]|jgi:DNA uptake protein ComE-like DNA-binding protein
MYVRAAALAFSIVMAVISLACARQDPQQLKEKTAQATADLKRNAKAVAEGVREGWSRDQPLDLNHARRQDLMSLPGMTAGEADAIIAGRPYSGPQDLLRRKIIPQSQYNRISDRITAK